MGTGTDKKISIRDIQEPKVQKPPDEKSLDEQQNYEQEQKNALRLNLIQNIRLRKSYARKLFMLMSFWLLGVFAIVLFVGLHKIPKRKNQKVKDPFVVGLTTHCWQMIRRLKLNIVTNSFIVAVEVI